MTLGFGKSTLNNQIADKIIIIIIYVFPFYLSQAVYLQATN